MSGLPTDVHAFDTAHLEELSSRPNSTVYTVKHDHVHEPWPVERLRPVLERLATRVVSFDDDVDDFRVRKTCMEEDAEILAFQRDHPKFYWMLTDRKLMREPKFRDTVKGLLPNGRREASCA